GDGREPGTGPVALAYPARGVRRRVELRAAGRRRHHCQRIAAPPRITGGGKTDGERMSRGSIVFLDDETELCDAAAEWLTVNGFAVTTFTSPRTALQRIDPYQVDCVVTDVRMPELSGLDVLRHLREAAPELPVVLLTGHGDVPLAVEAMQAGAYDFI